MKKIAIILSGCGVFDGAEIHESVLTLLELDKRDATYQCLAPNVAQTKVINHLTQDPVSETRNVLTESARIARGNIKDLATVSPDDFAAAILPGGFGAALNLCSFALEGANHKVNPEVANFLQKMHKAGKPLGFICIAPAIIPKIMPAGIKGTIGNDKETAAAFNAMGGEHVTCEVGDIVIDKGNKVVSTPAYMLANRISEAHAGISKLVATVLQMV